MQKKVVIFVLVALNATCLFSQERKIGVPLSEVRKNKNQLDLDVKNIFDYYLGGATLLYKRVYQIGNLVDVNSIKLFRFSATVNNKIVVKEPYSNIFVAEPVDALEMGFTAGLEWQKSSKNFVYYYGIDAGIGFTKYSYYGGSLMTNGSRTDYSVTTETLGTGISPLFGLKYYFTDRISIGVETGLSVSFFSQSATETISAVDVINGTQQVSTVTYEPIKSSGIQTSFNNLKFVTVGFAF